MNDETEKLCQLAEAIEESSLPLPDDITRGTLITLVALVRRLEKTIALKDQYIEVLAKAESNFMGFALTHGIGCDPKLVAEGKRLREEISAMQDKRESIENQFAVLASQCDAWKSRAEAAEEANRNLSNLVIPDTRIQELTNILESKERAIAKLEAQLLSAQQR